MHLDLNDQDHNRTTLTTSRPAIGMVMVLILRNAPASTMTRSRPPSIEVGVSPTQWTASASTSVIAAVPTLGESDMYVRLYCGRYN
jgi:hypothetical protein